MTAIERHAIKQLVALLDDHVRTWDRFSKDASEDADDRTRFRGMMEAYQVSKGLVEDLLKATEETLRR